MNLLQDVSGVISVRPNRRGVKQNPPLKVLVELAGPTNPEGLAERIRQRLREKLIVTTEIVLVPPSSLPRSEYKSKLVDYIEASDETD